MTARQLHACGKCLRRWFLGYPSHGKAASRRWSLLSKGIRHVLTHARVLHECWQNLEDPKQSLSTSHLPLWGASHLSWWGGTHVWGPSAAGRIPRHNVPSLQPRVAGGNLPTSTKGLGTWTAPRFPGTGCVGWLLSDHCRFMQWIKVITENLCQASDDFHCKWCVIRAKGYFR